MKKDLGRLKLKLHEMQFQSNANEDTAKCAKPSMLGKGYLAVSELTLEKSR